MNNYLQSGSVYRIVPGENVHSDLPSDTYEAAFNTDSGEAYLIRKSGMAEINAATKIYGNARSIAQHCIDAWNRRGKHTGVLLSGVYGCGKTITAQLIAVGALEAEHVPVIYVPADCVGTAVLKMIDSITTRCVVIFDELDKTCMADDYGPGPRTIAAGLLSLLDGCTLNDHLYVMTANDVRRLPDGLLNRPGRVLYHWQHNYLDAREVREVCEDRGVPEEHTTALCKMSGMVQALTYDTLNALITECLEFKVSPVEALTYMNIRAPEDRRNQQMFNLSFEYDGEVYRSSQAYLSISGNGNDELYLPTELSEKSKAYSIRMHGRCLIDYIRDDQSIEFVDSDTGIKVLAEPCFDENLLTHKAIWKGVKK